MPAFVPLCFIFRNFSLLINELLLCRKCGIFGAFCESASKVTLIYTFISLFFHSDFLTFIISIKLLKCSNCLIDNISLAAILLQFVKTLWQLLEKINTM